MGMRKATSLMEPTALDLFSGCGGLTLGLKQGGFNVLGAVDIDPLSVETYRANHEEVTVWDVDIRDLAPAQMQSSLGIRLGDLGLLAACPPCQGFSTIRTLNGALVLQRRVILQGNSWADFEAGNERVVDDPRNVMNGQ